VNSTVEHHRKGTEISVYVLLLYCNDVIMIISCILWFSFVQHV